MVTVITPTGQTTWISAGIFGYELHKVGEGCIGTLWWNGRSWELVDRRVPFPAHNGTWHSDFRFDDAASARAWAYQTLTRGVV